MTLPYVATKSPDGWKACIAEGTVIGRGDGSGFETREELEAVMREIERVLNEREAKCS